jgi:hypothetical protein
VSPGERGFEGALHGRGLVGDLAVREAQGAPAGGGVDGVAAAVGFEGVPRFVVLPAVGLDEDAVGVEDEVGFEELDVVVDGGLWEAGGAAELQEAFIEFGLREGGAGAWSWSALSSLLAPRWPAWARARASRGTSSPSRAFSARSSRRSMARVSRCAARSRIVRPGVVTGMPSFVVV